MGFRAWLIAMVLWLPGWAWAADPIVLAGDGQARAAIVLPQKASPAEQTAARELKSHLDRVTGAEFPIIVAGKDHEGPRLLIGAVARERAAEHLDGVEQFAVRRVGKDILLAGGGDRGTLYAVYSFLETEIGCRWLTWWGDESIPHRRELSAQVRNRLEAPATGVRDILVHSALPHTRPEQLRDFLVRNRVQGPEFTFFEQGQPPMDLEPWGGMSHRYIRPPHIAHSSFFFIPPETYFKDHPEYFSLINGQRTPDQLCYSNPQLRALLTERILKRIEEAGGRGNLSLSLQDSLGACQCDGCRAIARREGVSGEAGILDFVVELAPRVQARFPEAYLTTLAYFTTAQPPRTLQFPDNVIVIFAPLGANSVVPLTHPRNARWLEYLQGWRKQARRLWVWYYPLPYDASLPVGPLTRLQADLKLFRDLGIEGFFIEQDAPGVYDRQRMSEMLTWIIARLLWNPDADLQGLIGDFAEHYYGPAGEELAQYAADLERATQDRPTMVADDVPMPSPDYAYLDGALLLKAQERFARAEEQVKDDPQYLSRVRKARASLDLATRRFWAQLAPADQNALKQIMGRDQPRTTAPTTNP